MLVLYEYQVSRRPISPVVSGCVDLCPSMSCIRYVTLVASPLGRHLAFWCHMLLLVAIFQALKSPSAPRHPTNYLAVALPWVTTVKHLLQGFEDGSNGPHTCTPLSLTIDALVGCSLVVDLHGSGIQGVPLLLLCRGFNLRAPNKCNLEL